MELGGVRIPGGLQYPRLSRDLGEEGVLCSHLHPRGAELLRAELVQWEERNRGSNRTDCAVLAYHGMFLHCYISITRFLEIFFPENNCY